MGRLGVRLAGVANGNDSEEMLESKRRHDEEMLEQKNYSYPSLVC